jgi:nucleoid-associated protein YgaU
VPDSGLVKASLEYKNSEDVGILTEIPFGLKPTDYTISASTSWKQTPAKGKSAPKSEYTGSLPKTLTMDVLFVNNYTGKTVAVWLVCQELLNMTRPTPASVDKNKPSSPVLLFRWGKLVPFMDCRLKSATIKYTMFDDQGEITMATASITLEEVESDLPGQNPTSGGVPGNRAHVVSEGDSLPAIAFREYDDAALWRGLADLNGIDDPMRLRIGQRLIVPPFEQVVARS